MTSVNTKASSSVSPTKLPASEEKLSESEETTLKIAQMLERVKKIDWVQFDSKTRKWIIIKESLNSLEIYWYWVFYFAIIHGISQNQTHSFELWQIVLWLIVRSNLWNNLIHNKQNPMTFRRMTFRISSSLFWVPIDSKRNIDIKHNYAFYLFENQCRMCWTWKSNTWTNKKISRLARY